MRRSLALVLTLVAWLMATGSHWDLVQTFGWGRMIATYSQSMPLTQAVRLTFTADNFCGVCDLVNDANADSRDSSTGGAPSELKKVQLAYLATPEIVIARVNPPRLVPRDQRAPASRERVPLRRPPRTQST